MMIAELMLAAVVAGHVDVDVTWEPPVIWDPPAMEWADRCEAPTNAVVLQVDAPLQYRIEATNDHGWTQVWMADTGRLATLRLPLYDEPSTNVLVVIAEYPEPPLESEPSCPMVYVTDAVRPAPHGLRIVGAEATFGPGEPVARLVLDWAAVQPMAPVEIAPMPFMILPGEHLTIDVQDLLFLPGTMP